MADKNIKVFKTSTNNQTHSQSVALTGNELYYEIARLMGANLDEKGIQVSIDLKEKCNKSPFRLSSLIFFENLIVS